MDSCGRGTEYRHSKTYEECKQLAEDFTAQLKPKINEDGKLTWSTLLETVNHDELVYKPVSYTHLTLPTSDLV